jgi:hypothetical protein
MFHVTNPDPRTCLIPFHKSPVSDAAIHVEVRPEWGVDPSMLSFTSCSWCSGRDPDVAQAAQPQPSQEQPTGNFSDGSGPLFNMYIKMEAEEDNEMTDR